MSLQICSSLLPLCRKYIFRSIDLRPLTPLVASLPPSSHLRAFQIITRGFRSTFRISAILWLYYNFADTDVLWVLGRLRYFRLSGWMVNYWNVRPMPRFLINCRRLLPNNPDFPDLQILNLLFIVNHTL